MLGAGGNAIVLQFKYENGVKAVKVSYPYKLHEANNAKSAAKFIQQNKSKCGNYFKYLLDFQYIGKSNNSYFFF